MLSNSFPCLTHRRRMALAVAWALASGHALSASTADNVRQALQSGQLDLAARLVQQERQQSPRDVQIRFLEGVVLAQQGQTDKAIESFGKLVQSHPEIVEAHNNLGVLYASKGRLEEARKALEAGMQAHASYATLHRNLGDVQSQLARQTYAKALQVDSKSRQAIPQLSLLGSMGPLPTVQTPPAQMPTAQTPLLPSPPIAAVPVSSPVPASTPVPVPSPAPAAARPAPAPAAPSPAPASSAPAPKAEAGKPAARATAVTPADRPDAAEAEAVRTAVQAWAKAWSRKDMDLYLQAYAASFVPPEHQPRGKWEADRRQRILSKKTISVELRQLKVSANGKTATAQFQQIYTSDNFTGNSRKTLEMVKQGNRWLIARETVN